MTVAKYLVAGSVIPYIYIGALLCNVSCDSGEVLWAGSIIPYIYIEALLCNVSCDSGEVLSGGEYHTIYKYRSITL